MDRRAFLGALGLLAAARGADAQPAGRVYRISSISQELPAQGGAQRFWDAFAERLRELGWSPERNVLIEHRAFGLESGRISGIAQELITLGTDVFVVGNSTVAGPIRRTTRTVPIVTWAAGDLVAAGLAASLARPGGNVTGVQVMQTEIGGKHLSLLKEAIPGLSRVGVLAGEHGLREAALPPATAAWLHEIKSRAPALGLRVRIVVVGDGQHGEFEQAFAAFKAERMQAVILYGSTLMSTYRKAIAELAAAKRLPTICLDATFLALGHLMSYGWDRAASLRLAAECVDQILRGANAGDIPIRQPTTFRLGINLTRAKALGLTIPPLLLARADQVIE